MTQAYGHGRSSSSGPAAGESLAGVAAAYLASVSSTLGSIEVTVTAGQAMPVGTGVERLISLIPSVDSRNKVMFIGNGGSATLSSHAAVDWFKNGGVRALAFNDPANLTALSNDFAYDRVFELQIERFADKGDVLVAISSSGKSPNILNGVAAARRTGCAVCTMTGFAARNPLRALGDLNFYVPSDSYGHVEISHSALLHSVMSILMNRRLGTPQTHWR